MTLNATELQQNIALWRAKAAAGELTLEESRQIIAIVRGERRTAAESSDAARRAKAKKAVPTADELLKKFGL